MIEDEYQTVLRNWTYRAAECEQASIRMLSQFGMTSHQYRRMRALMAGYQAAIQAARAERDKS